MDDFISVGDCAAEGRRSIHALRIPSSVHASMGWRSWWTRDVKRRAEAGQKEKPGTRHIQGSVRRGQIRPALGIRGPGEDRYAIPICAEACVTFHA